ncbi:MAG: hypothetical protein ACK559_02625, partial [bacterium]
MAARDHQRDERDHREERSARVGQDDAVEKQGQRGHANDLHDLRRRSDGPVQGEGNRDQEDPSEIVRVVHEAQVGDAAVLDGFRPGPTHPVDRLLDAVRDEHDAHTDEQHHQPPQPG